MKAAVLYGPHQPLQMEELEKPDVDDNDVLIKVAVSGVCHTDLGCVEGVIPPRAPTVLGHEVAGIVEGVGRLQRNAFKEGDRVIVGMRYKCGRCRYCMAGRDNLCQNVPVSPPLKKGDGTVINRWNVGGFAEYVAVPGYMVYGLPEEVGLEEACIVGCRVTTAYNAVKHGAELEAGESALVLGCGGVGLNTIQILKCFGAYPIIAVDVLEEKLEAAKRYGATHTIDATKDDPVEATRAITDGGADKSFEAIGNPKTADQCVGAIRPGGTAVLIGALVGRPVTISDGSFAFKEKRVTGVAMRRANDVTEVLELARQGRIDLKSLITKKYDHEKINDTLADLGAGKLIMGVTLWG